MRTLGRLPRRLRLIDGVVVAAGALLLLKLVGLLVGPSQPDVASDGLPRFAHVLAHARSNHTVPDPATTGALLAKPAGPASGEPIVVVDPASPGARRPPDSSAERAIHERLGERREELDQRARELESREKLIEETERRLDTKVGHIKAEDDKRAGAAASPPDQESADLKGLVIMYESMKPKEAARVFDRLPHDVLVPVVRLVNPRKMAEILAAMTPENAEKLTVALARRRPAAEERSATASALAPGELPGIDLPARAGTTPAAKR